MPTQKKTSPKTTEPDLDDVDYGAEEESLAATIAAEDEPPKKPQNSPALRPWAQLSRRERANFQSTWSANLPASVLSSAEDAEMDLEKLGTRFLFNYLADVEDALAVVAINEELYRKWAQRADDEALQALFAWYQRVQASGE